VAPFFAEALCAFSNSARFSAQRRFVASMILFLPAALSLRLRCGASGVTIFKEGADCCLVASHRFRCASAIRFRPAALMRRRIRSGGSAAGDAHGIHVLVVRLKLVALGFVIALLGNGCIPASAVPLVGSNRPRVRAVSP
jgi:hypothetical protein